jgi:hypothetical protein
MKQKQGYLETVTLLLGKRETNTKFKYNEIKTGTVCSFNLKALTMRGTKL